MISTSFWNADGQPVSAEEFIKNLFGVLLDFFKDEEELRMLWSNPTTRKAFLDKISDLGFGKDQLEIAQKLIDVENSDLFDVLAYIAFSTRPISRQQRVSNAKKTILHHLNDKQKDFIEFVLNKYQEKGSEELDEEKLPVLLNLKYHAITDAEQSLGSVEKIRATFFDFQKKLYK